MEGDTPSPIVPQVPGWYWAIPKFWQQSKDNLGIVEVVASGDGLGIDDGLEGDLAPLDEYVFYSEPLPKPEIPRPAAWYKPESAP